MKKIPAFFAALLITGIVGLAMLGIGGAAFMNTNKLPITSLPTSPTVAPVDFQNQNQAQIQATPTQPQAQTDQNQAQLDAYKAQLDQAIQRINNANTQIQQLQAQLDTTNQQLNNASALAQQYQNILAQLQQRGLIRIGSDGSITIRGRFDN